MVAIMNLINNTFIAVSGWFVDVFTSSGMTDIYLSILFIFLASKFIISPLFGRSVGSDHARTNKQKQED